jgi:uncharacterized membrane protein SpoIIM required for sporulation
MKQAVFEQQHEPDWSRFERWLERREKLRRSAADTAADPNPLPDMDVPQVYRRLCQHLALARDREYSPEIVDRLNALVLRGHHLLYGARARRGAQRSLAFILGSFPRLVRAEGPLFTASALLFFGPVAIFIAALQWFPDFIYYVLDPRTVANFQEMYNPAHARLGPREADDNVMMFGYYIWNNVKIGIQTFATGLAFGLGSIYFLVANGVIIGAVAGYLTQAGYAQPFWSFVSGHSAMELTAIVISGAAGLRLGGAVVAPGLQSRKAALVAAAQPAVRLMYGAGVMFVIAAFIEAFWSPLNLISPSIKYAVGAVMWALVIGWLAVGGRSSPPGTGIPGDRIGAGHTHGA